MVEINNQRKAFLDMLAWSEGTITIARKPEIMAGRHCRRRHALITPDHPRKLIAKPKTQINRPDATSFFPVGGMPTASSFGLKDFPKSQDAVALQQIKERGAYL